MKNKKEILLMQEAERRRIAEKLHNTTVQDIIYLSQKLALVGLYMDNDAVHSRLELAIARKQIKSIVDGIRETIYDLRPMTFDDIGYDAAFERLYDKLKRMGYSVVFDIDNVSTEDGVTAISIYHIVSESCQNIIKHSQATNVFVRVKRNDDKIKVIISDNGIGFSQSDRNYNIGYDGRHFGLSFIQERVDLLSGNMKIVSDENGTSVNVVIPIKNQ